MVTLLLKDGKLILDGGAIMEDTPECRANCGCEDCDPATIDCAALNNSYSVNWDTFVVNNSGMCGSGISTGSVSGGTKTVSRIDTACFWQDDLVDVCPSGSIPAGACVATEAKASRNSVELFLTSDRGNCLWTIEIDISWPGPTCLDDPVYNDAAYFFTKTGGGPAGTYTLSAVFTQTGQQTPPVLPATATVS